MQCTRRSRYISFKKQTYQTLLKTNTQKKSKTLEHKAKIGRGGLIMLQNINTLGEEKISGIISISDSFHDYFLG